MYNFHQIEANKHIRKIMLLHSYIRASPSSRLLPLLQNSFQHGCSLLPFPSRQASNAQLYGQVLSTLKPPPAEHRFSQCLILYNVALSPEHSYSLFSRAHSSWECDVSSFCLRTGATGLDKKGISQEEFHAFFSSISLESHSLYSFEIRPLEGDRDGWKRRRRFFFLPPAPASQAEITCSAHQMIKLFYFLKVYFSLEEQPTEETMFQSGLSHDFNSFLYQNRVQKVSILLNCQEQLSSDERVLQLASQLQVPEAWREKESYRLIKRDIFLLKRQESLSIRHLKSTLGEVTKTINDLQSLVGLPSLHYPQISVETLKNLKSQSFSEKVGLISDSEQSLEAMEIRLCDLKDRREELKKEKKRLQQTQLSEMLTLKVSVFNFQVTSQARTDSKFFFKRDKPQFQKELIETLLSRVDKRKCFPRADNKKGPSSRLTNRSQSNSRRRSSIKVKEDPQRRKELKAAEKKVTAVVNQGVSSNNQLNLSKLREEHEMEQLAIEFELEKQLENRRASYQKALRELNVLIEGNDELYFI